MGEIGCSGCALDGSGHKEDCPVKVTNKFKPEEHCSFCGRNPDEVFCIVQSAHTPRICDSCVELARDYVGQKRLGTATPSIPDSGIPTTMITCPVCGNKRCPKATDKSRDCSGSNEPGQT